MAFRDLLKDKQWLQAKGSVRAEMQATPELLEAVQPHTQGPLANAGVACSSAVQAALPQRLGKAAGETKPAQLCLAH